MNQTQLLNRLEKPEAFGHIYRESAERVDFFLVKSHPARCKMLLYIVFAETQRGGHTVGMAHAGHTRDQAICRAIRQKLALQVATDSFLL